MPIFAPLADLDGTPTADTILAYENAGSGQGNTIHGGGDNADDRIIYNPATGNLYYDPDGTGAASATLFAQLTNKAALSADNFDVIQS